jgi:glycosyltransferase involved in cell wall biosynthesis
MKVAYAIVELVHGAGQTAWLTNLVRWGSQKWQSTIVTKIASIPDTSFLNQCPIIQRSYLASVFDERVRQVFREADIIHVKSGWPFYFVASYLQTPIIYTLHGPDPTWLFSGRKRVNRYLASLAETRIPLRKACAVVSVSDWVAEWYRIHRHISSVVIPDAVDVSLFRVDGSKSRDGLGVRLLCVGDWDGWNGRKRTHDLLPLLRELEAVFPECRLTLAGLSQGSIQQLTKLVESLGLESRVRLVGRLPDSELASLYRESDIYVAPTIVEGFYRPIVEAFASGLPAVVRDARNVVDSVNQSPLHHVQASGAGESYDGTPKSFIRAISTTLASYDSLSARAIAYARRFDLDRVLPLYQHLYEQLGVA